MNILQTGFNPQPFHFDEKLQKETLLDQRLRLLKEETKKKEKKQATRYQNSKQIIK